LCIDISGTGSGNSLAGNASRASADLRRKSISPADETRKCARRCFHASERPVTRSWLRARRPWSTPNLGPAAIPVAWRWVGYCASSRYQLKTTFRKSAADRRADRRTLQLSSGFLNPSLHVRPLHRRVVCLRERISRGVSLLILGGMYRYHHGLLLCVFLVATGRRW
jgi:hypothetical protein